MHKVRMIKMFQHSKNATIAEFVDICSEDCEYTVDITWHSSTRVLELSSRSKTIYFKVSDVVIEESS